MRTFAQKPKPTQGAKQSRSTNSPLGPSPLSQSRDLRSAAATRQPKLNVGDSGDACEQAADRTAAQVLNALPLGSNPPLPSEKPSEKSARTGSLAPKMSSAPGGESLPPALQTSMSAHLGFDFSNVKVHANGAAARKASALRARAFTRGPDVFFNRGQYAPNTLAGRQLIGHELAHVVQQSHLPAGDGAGLPIQCASLISDKEYFLFVNQKNGNGFGFADLVRAVQRRYQLDRSASWMLASWLNKRHRVFHSRTARRYDRIRVDMPRAVAFFVVDWVEPFNPFVGSSAKGSKYRIGSEAFDHAQEIFARQNVFVGFRRGRGMTDPALRQVKFQDATNPDKTPRLNSPADLKLLAQRPSGALPPGFFHIVVTGSTTESKSAAGKSVRSSSRQPISDASQGIILFAEVYARYGYKQRVGPKSTEPELGELLSHEIGHFLFNLSHSDLVDDPATGGFKDVPRRGIMKQGHTGLVRSKERFSAESRRDIDKAFQSGGVIPQPQTPTSRKSR